MIPLRVLGDRVLVKPDVDPNAPQQTEAGIYVAKSLAAAVMGEDASTSLCRGTVIAVGKPRHPLYDVAEDLAQRIESVHLMQCARVACDYCDSVHMLRDLVRRQPCCNVGDDVLFAHDAGQLIELDGTRYIILKEDELLAIVEPEEEAAA